jgi:hypothetical protein
MLSHKAQLNYNLDKNGQLTLEHSQMQNERNAEPMQAPTENEYPVYPEDDGYDRFRNPYSPH